MAAMTMSALQLTLKVQSSVFQTRHKRKVRVNTQVRAASDPMEVAEEATPAPPVGYCLGMAGSLPPFEKFDPLNYLESADENQIKLYREAELTHGRVSMLAVLGCAVGENFNPLFDGKITGPAIYHFQQVPGLFWTTIVFLIACAEGFRLTYGWVNPVGEGEDGSDNLWTLRKEYAPGDIGFDPLGLRPTDAQEWESLQNKELSNGRLAMIGIAGIVVQELVTGEKVFDF